LLRITPLFLTQLLEKDAVFKIKGEQKQAVDRLKAALMEEPVLKDRSQDAKTQLHVEASRHGRIFTFPTLRRK